MLDGLKDQDLKRILERAVTVAVVGAKDKPGQPVDLVGRYLIRAGYNVIPVHPKRQGVWELKTYPSLDRIPDKVDIVDLFRAAAYCPEHAREVLNLGYAPLAFWMQLGIFSSEARKILKSEPIAVVEDRCIKTEHQRLIGTSGA